MAKNIEEVKEVDVENTEIKSTMEFKSDTKYWVTNLCNWLTGTKRSTTTGDISIPANGKILLTDEEIRGQIYDNNSMFVGTDGRGSHARYYVENKDFRIDVGFETETEKQLIIDEKAIKEILAITNFNTFKETVEKKIITDAEKYSLISYAKKNKCNDYEKITFMEKYTEYKY